MTKEERRRYYAERIERAEEEEKEQGLKTATTVVGAAALNKGAASVRRAGIAQRDAAKVAERAVSSEKNADVKTARGLADGKNKHKAKVKKFKKEQTAKIKNLRTNTERGTRTITKHKISKDGAAIKRGENFGTYLDKTKESITRRADIKDEIQELKDSGNWKGKAKRKQVKNLKRNTKEITDNVKGVAKHSGKHVKRQSKKLYGASKSAVKTAGKKTRVIAGKGAAKLATKKGGKMLLRTAAPMVGAALTAADLVKLAKTINNKKELERKQRAEEEKLRRGINLQ
jgi:hypothetical protein